MELLELGQVQVLVVESGDPDVLLVTVTLDIPVLVVLAQV